MDPVVEVTQEPVTGTLSMEHHLGLTLGILEIRQEWTLDRIASLPWPDPVPARVTNLHGLTFWR